MSTTTQTAALVDNRGKIFRRYANLWTAGNARDRLPGGEYLRVLDLQVPEGRIRALRSEAITAGDAAMAAACDKALAGRPQALATVAVVLIDAEAQS